jgi:hypothetical protein
MMMRKMKVSMFKVKEHIIYSYSNITVCGRPETFSSGARHFLSSARSAVVVSGTPPNMYPKILPALDLNSIISVSSAGLDRFVRIYPRRRRRERERRQHPESRSGEV